MRKVLLVVRDGWGYSTEERGNAVRMARVPNNDFYERNYPWTLLKCTGNAVGVPEGTQGGSEPGHLTMGAGRIVWQPFEDINRKIRSGEFFNNPALLLAVENCKKNNSSLHLMGLFSDEGIHGTTEHLYALLELAKRNGLTKVFVHAILDGRDVPERSAIKYLREFEERSKKIGVGRIASINGRYYGMDRDNNYDRTEKAYRLYVYGEGVKEVNVFSAVENAYAAGDKTDYYVRPIVLVDESGKPIATVKEKDSLIFWNFRSDRARQITYAFVEEDFNGFDRGKKLDIVFVCMSEYDANLSVPYAFKPQEVKNNLGQVISQRGLNQLRVAETEKYAHVTFFFNSQVEEPNPGEDRVLVPSPKVPSYDLKPEMSAYEITEVVLNALGSEKYAFILVNFANGDLVGHSAKLEAGIKACEAVDECVGKIFSLALKKGFVCLLTGDHGNIECMFYPNGEPNPSHGTNPVPFFLISDEPCLKNARLRSGGGLSDVAPTVLELMGIEKPVEMTGESLILK